MTARDAHAGRGHRRRGMHPLGRLIPLEDALRLALEAVGPVDRSESVSLADSLRRVSAEDVRSPTDVPRADRAAMDGYAVRSEDTAPAGPSAPALLTVRETLYADRVARRRVGRGACAEVATGSTLPAGADAVVMVEDTQRDGDRVRVHRPVRPGENVSRRGADIAKGSPVVRRGEAITPARLGALAAIGRARVAAFARPRVALLVTGDEIVAPGRPLRRGQVYDINSATMSAVVRESGGEPVVLGRVRDRMDAHHAALTRALRADLAVFSGGSSVGEKDLIADVLRARGEVLFHGVAVRPGKPTLLGRVGGKAVLGMPGNPTSCLSNAYLFLAPMVRKMAHLPPPTERMLELPLAADLATPAGRAKIFTVRVAGGQAVPAFKESGAITSMSQADGYIEIAADVERLAQGTRVRVVLF